MKPFFCRALLITTLCSCILPAICLAQVKKIPVAVSHTGDDFVGQGVAYSLKEAVRASQSHRLVDDEGVPSFARIVITLVSLDSADSSQASAKHLNSAISVSLVYDSREVPVDGAFISSSVKICGRDRVESCAKSILPSVDHAAERLRRDWPRLWNDL